MTLPTLIGFNGRADRGDFWKIQLLSALLSVPFMIATLGPLQGQSIWAVLLHQIAAMSMLMALVVWAGINVRRLHDLGQSGWLCWGYLIPLLNIFLLWHVGFGKGQSVSNRHGPKPNAWWHRTKHWNGR